jgi:hypothetical protein
MLPFVDDERHKVMPTFHHQQRATSAIGITLCLSSSTKGNISYWHNFVPFIINKGQHQLLA